MKIIEKIMKGIDVYLIIGNYGYCYYMRCIGLV